ncbi:MAG: hypothetical protein RSB78_01490 [Oscillospiraceae bacterium]
MDVFRNLMLKTTLAAAIAGGIMGIVCSTVSCIKLCAMEQMLCSSAQFRAKL